jgi:hypothetical protein
MLSPNEQIIVRSFAEQIQADIRTAIKTKRITKFGAVNSSGRLHDSVEIVYADNGFKIIANGYIDSLIWGRRPGSFPPIAAIESWIREKPISSSLPIKSLAYAIAQTLKGDPKESNLYKYGNMVWRTHKGANSGLLEDALAQGKFDTFIDLIASQAVEGLTENIVNAFDIKTE